MTNLVSRLTEWRTAVLFGRNTIASFFAFGLDVALLWLLVEHFGWVHLPAAAISFIIAMTLHYVLSRLWVFKGTERGVAQGYAYFLINAGIGLVVTLGAFFALMEFTDLYYLVSRVLASVVAGVLVFGLNAVFNFKAV